MCHIAIWKVTLQGTLTNRWVSISYTRNGMYRVSQKVLKHFNRLWLQNWITYESFFRVTNVSMKCHFVDKFGKTVNLNFNGLTEVNSLCSISSQEKTKRGRFLCPHKLIVRSLHVVDRYQNLYGITIRMRINFSLRFRSIALIGF